MPQFLVRAYDNNAPATLDRRVATRPKHLEKLQPLIDRGAILSAGAMLNDAGKVIGSMLVMDMPSREELDRWAENEPYKQAGVWARIEVTPLRIVVRDSKLVA